ncbi:dihydrodipicolinate synthase family protein [candidate division KSB1 bacterium]|nr:dihydrodipicolinate synthase family protein [candidate division KSB1 bacterium]
MTNEEKLAGVFAPVNTPFINDELQLDHLQKNLEFYRTSKLRGYLALGSNGEFRSMSEKEQREILELFAEHKGDKIIMVGVACESTRETIEKAKRAAAMAFDYASVLTPGYFAKFMSGDALQAHFERIADASPIPLVLYNAPQFAGGVKIPPKTVAALAAHENIVGIKDSSAEGPGQYLSIVDPNLDFSILSGSSSTFYPSLHIGACGGIISLANVFPDAVVELYQAWRSKNYDKARQLHFRLARLTTAVSGAYGVAGVKAAMNIVGLHGDEPRSPMRPVPETEVVKIRTAMVRDGFIIESSLVR